MIVCHCKAITDRKIRELARRGARTGRDVGIECQAGTCCGGCAPLIEAMLRNSRRSRTGPSRVKTG